MTPDPARRRHQNVTAIAVALIGTASIAALMSINGLIPYDNPAFANYDHHSYMAIATEGPGAPGKASAPPFCWRLLTPFLVRLIPAPLPVAFFLVSFGAVAAATYLIYVLLLTSGLSHEWSLLGEISYLSCFWAVGFSLWDYLMVDATSLLIVIAGLVVLEREDWPAGGRRVAIVALLALGALNKESYLALAAAAFVYWVRRDTGSLAARCVRSAMPIVPAIFVMLLVRFSITPDASQMKEFSSYSLESVFLTMLLSRLQRLPALTLNALVDPWGPLVLVPALFGLRRAIRWFGLHPHRLALVVVAFAQTFVATSVGRLVAVAAPVMVLYSIESLHARFKDARPQSRLIVSLLALQFLFQYVRRTTLGLSLPPYEPNPLVTASYGIRVAALVSFAAIWALAGRSRARGPFGSEGLQPGG